MVVIACTNFHIQYKKDISGNTPASLSLFPSRLKELLLKERSGRSELETRIEELEGRCQSLTQQLEQARSSGEHHKTALHQLEESISHGEALRARQQAEEVQ